MHLNSCLMIGRVSPKGPALRYAESGSPCCSFVLEVDEVTNGKTFTTYIPCEISGKYAEQTSVEVEAGDEIQISGKWKYKSVVDQKSGAKVSKPVVSSWGVSQRIPGPSTLAQDETSREIDTSRTCGNRIAYKRRGARSWSQNQETGDPSAFAKAVGGEQAGSLGELR